MSAGACFRASYGIHYGEVFRTTYMRTRYNPPEILSLNINSPDLSNPLKDFSLDNLDPNERTDFNLLDPNLVSPYSHQYNFTWELRPTGDWVVELGYVGSRSHKLLAGWTENRGGIGPGVESTTSNANERRPDPRYADVFHILNGSRAFYDAAKVTLRVPNLGGVEHRRIVLVEQGDGPRLRLHQHRSRPRCAPQFEPGRERRIRHHEGPQRL